MKRFLLIASCAFLSVGLFSSCQKEEKSALDLAKELTAELQKVKDLKSAEASAPRVEVLNKRFQHATVRPLACKSTALQRSGDEDPEGQEGAALQDALKALAKEIGRVQASLPVASWDGDVDRDQLLMATGAANGAGDTAPAARRKAVGTAHMHGEAPKNETPGTFSEYYGSTKLREALEYTSSPGSIGAFDFEDDPEAVPETVVAGDDEPADDDSGDTTPAADGDDTTPTPAADDDDTTPTPAADDDDTTPTPAPAADDDDGGLPSLDLDTDTTDDTTTDDSTTDDSTSGGDDDGFGIEI